MTFLNTERSLESYLEKITVMAKSTQDGFKKAYKNFNTFTKSQYKGSDAEQIIQELLALKGEKRELAAYNCLQTWINYNEKTLSPSSIMGYFSNISKYHYYRGIKLTPQDIKENLTFPRKLQQDPHPLTLEEIRKIMSVTSYKRQSIYLAMTSSGMRIGEVIRIRKKDLDLTGDRVKVNIPAGITKTKRSRITFLSQEASKHLRLSELDDNDFVWGTSKKFDTNRALEEMMFRKYLYTVGLTEKDEETGLLKINLHSFRAYFFTRAAKIHDEGYAHAMTGHGAYLAVYNRLSDGDKLERYLELESELLVFDESRKNAEIHKLKKEKAELEIKNNEVRNLKEKAKNSEERLNDFGQVLEEFEKFILTIGGEKALSRVRSL